MALVIGDKVFRNLPEQVAYLQECVEQLNHDLINKEYSIQEINIVDGHLIFGLVNGVEIDAGLVRGITNIEIDASQHLIVNYDDNTSEDVGNLGDFSNVDFVAKTISQTQANFSQLFDFATSSGLTITNVYNRCAVINNILHIIANVKVKNTSGTTQKIGGGWSEPAYKAFTLPTSIAEKIYDIDGVSAHDIGTNGKIITSVPATCASGTISASNLATYNTFRFDLTNRNAEDGLSCYFRSNQMVELAVDEEIVLVARVALTLI